MAAGQVAGFLISQGLSFLFDSDYSVRSAWVANLLNFALTTIGTFILLLVKGRKEVS